MTSCDIVNVGGGVGGSALACALAATDLRIELIEREIEFVDRVRGEFIAPWGVVEARKLGIYDTLMAAGGHHVLRSVVYDEAIPPESAATQMLDLSTFVPGVPGPLCMQHVAMQNALIDLAAKLGVNVRRGTSEVTINPGHTPRVDYTWRGERCGTDCRLIVGADGRTSQVRRQTGLALVEDEIDHLVSGLLVDCADDWPADTQAFGKLGDIMFLAFPQGEGRVRLYVEYALSARGNYAGDAGARRLLKALDHAHLAGSTAFTGARPIGPCKAFPSQHAGATGVHIEGAVLIGDAAGYTDPIWGQGLSVTLRDARMVRDLLLSHSEWPADIFDTYAAERAERLRRIRYETRFATALYARFDAESNAARLRALSRMAEDPALGAMLVAGMAGPDALPADVFSDAFHARLFAP